MISVIIISYNTCDILLRCLGSLKTALSALEHEVLVVDNGSADGSADAVGREFSSVRVIRNGENRGFARACNQGIRESAGRWLLLLNSDTLLEERAIGALIAFMEEVPEAAAVGGQLVREDGSLQNSFANVPTLATELVNKSLLKALFPERYPGKGQTYRAPTEVETLIGACILVRREAVDTVGLLDEGYFFFLEETDWCLRMRQHGWKIYYHPAVKVLHLQGQSAKQAPTGARIEFYRSRYRFFSLHRSRRDQILLRAGLFAKLLIETLFSLAVSLVTGFLYPRERHRLRVRSALLVWHLLGCPDRWGLPREGAGKILQ